MEINKRSLNNKLRFLKDAIVKMNKPLCCKIKELGGITPLIFLKKFKNTPYLLGKLKCIYDPYPFLCKLFNETLTLKDISSLYLFTDSNVGVKNFDEFNVDFLNEKLMKSKYVENYKSFLLEVSQETTLLDFLENKF